MTKAATAARVWQCFESVERRRGREHGGADGDDASADDKG